MIDATRRDLTESYVEKMREWLQSGDILINGANSYYTDSVHRDEINLDLAEIAEAWRHASVVRSCLLDLSADVLANDQDLDGVEPFVADSGEGRWTALEGIEQGILTPVMTLALMARFASQGQQDYSAKLLEMIRNQFGGHAIRSANEATESTVEADGGSGK